MRRATAVAVVEAGRVIPACQLPFAPGVIPRLGATALTAPLPSLPHAVKLLLRAEQIKLKMNGAVKPMEAGLGRKARSSPS